MLLLYLLELAIRRLLIYMPCTGGGGWWLMMTIPTETAFHFDEARQLLGLLYQASSVLENSDSSGNWHQLAERVPQMASKVQLTGYS